MKLVRFITWALVLLGLILGLMVQRDIQKHSQPSRWIGAPHG
jgi:hypothetical protein